MPDLLDADKPTPRIRMGSWPRRLIKAIEDASTARTLVPKYDDMLTACLSANDVKVVILADSPYPDKAKANGLAFGHKESYTGPLDPALLAINKEIHKSLGQMNGDRTLQSWRQQGVLLLNIALTTEHEKAGAHDDLGYRSILASYITDLSMYKDDIVFMLWGRNAQDMADFIVVENRHLILEAPLPTSKKFAGCNHFKLANEFLHQHGHRAIQWGTCA